MMDMEEDSKVPLILGRPFMNTTKILVDMHDGQKNLRLHDEDTTFNVFESMYHTKDEKSCF